MKEETFTINKDKVYSSYYARACKIFPDWKLLSISLTTPNSFNGKYCKELNPPIELLYDYKHNLCSKEEYTERYYNNVLNNLNPTDIYNKLKGKVILCYCGKDSFCHRHLVLEWLEHNLGKEVIGGEI